MSRGAAIALAAAIVIRVACAPIEPDATIELTDRSIALDRSLVRAGHLVVAIHNGGTGAHEVAFFRTDADPDRLPYDTGLTQVTLRGPIAERDNVLVGATKRLSLDLVAGRYVVICNLPGHYAAGMRVTLEAR